MLLRLPSTRLQAFINRSCTSCSRFAGTVTPVTSTIALVLLLVTVAPVSAADDRPAVSPLVVPQPQLPATLIDPRTAMDFNQRGTYKAQNGDLEGAIADFNQAIQLKRDYATAYYNRGTAYTSIGNVRAALADYTQVISLKPNNAAVRYSRGTIRATVGDKQGAIDDFQQAAALYKQQLNVQWQQKALNQIEQLQPTRWWRTSHLLIELKKTANTKPRAVSF